MHIFAASCIISFLSSLPISVNGWGVRGYQVYIFGLLGIDQVKALSISLMIGSFSYLSIILFSFILLKQNLKKFKF